MMMKSSAKQATSPSQSHRNAKNGHSISQAQVAHSAAATIMLVSAEHPHQFTTLAIAAAIERAKR